ncbi:MAG: phosphatase PAP2 family protein [Chitinophagaceae bacterium]|nr:phosphatase PAP2 family protein [Chitinophagaceae bacterium]
MNWVDAVEKADEFLFLLIHTDADHQWLDPVMLILRNPFTWVPFYIFIAAYGVFKTGNFFWLLFTASIVVFSFTDILSAEILKPLIGRERPCFNTDLKPFIRNIIDCGGIYSFPSSHACNHFGLATVWYLFFKQYAGVKWKWLFIWAGVICYAQVYVGKHYPMDVLTGAGAGTIIGFAVMVITNFCF